jgi:teichuronic acid biosynthesis glycosyltransferase TuaH
MHRPSAPARATSALNPGKGDVAFAFAQMSWDAASRRGWFGTEDRLAKGLLTHERVHRLMVCDRARSLPLKLLRDRLSGGGGSAFPADEYRRLLAPVRLRRNDPTSIRGVLRAFGAYDKAMQRGAAEMGLQAPVVITTNPLLAGFAELSWAASVVFYGLDDWSAHPAYRRWWGAYRESYELMRKRECRVAAVSQVLLERLAPTGPSIVVPNGIETAEWAGSLHAKGPLAALPGPVLIYVGTLDSRLDVSWLLEIARAQCEGTVALVGPLVDAAHIERLRGEPNIAIIPPIARNQLVEAVRTADVGLIPHVRSALTEAMSPLKLYEYLAAGLPVVATDLEPMRGVDPRVVLVPDGANVASATRRALAMGRASERERDDFLQANSWNARHDALLEFALAGEAGAAQRLAA